MTLKLVIVCLMVAGHTLAAEEDLSNVLNNNLPPELQGKVDEKQIGELKNKTEALLKEKCLKNGGPNAYEEAQKASEYFKVCIQSLIDMETVQEEIKKAKPNGKVDEVFKKYCDKKPAFKNCFENMTKTAEVCMSADEKKHMVTVYNITEQLAEFICFKDGDRIALFIAEGGQECFQDKQDAIQACANKTFGAEIALNTNQPLSLDNLPTIAFNEKECHQMTELKLCVVGELEKCAQPTSANIMESLFKFVRKATPCKNIPEDGESKSGRKNKLEPSEVKVNSASTFSLISTTIIAAAVTLNYFV